MKKIEENYNLNIDYKVIFKDWTHYLNKLLTSNYMYNLMIFVQESYKFKFIYPKDKNSLFKPFSSIKFQDVRVIIISDEPYQNTVNNGIPIANKTSFFELERGLNKVERNIEKNHYDGLNLYMDSTLKHWYEQGILTLYSAFTVERGKKGSHQIQWRNFTREIVKALSDNKTGLIFLLWGKEAQEFKSCINRKVHYILEDNGPNIDNKLDWNCTHFEDVNKIIEEHNGKEFCIKW